jgi:tetratricopeptide (TPR) repeat protein
MFMALAALPLLSCLFGCGKSVEIRVKEFMSLRMYGEAIEVLSKELKRDPVNPGFHFILGKCYLEKADFARGDVDVESDLRNSEMSFDRAAQLDPAQAKKISQEYIERAKVLMAQGNSLRAGTLFELARKYDPAAVMPPSYAEAIVKLNGCVSNMKAVEHAIELYNKENGLQPNNIPLPEQLVTNGWLRYWPKCASGGNYTMIVTQGAAGRVTISCSMHGTLKTSHIQ